MKEREGYKSEQIRNQAFFLTDINNNQKKVLEVIIKWQPICNEMIAAHLGWYPHQVTPRVLELRQLGYIEWAGEGISQKSKRKVSLWRISKIGKQLSIF
ncbi:MAG: hypothetical protein NZM09_10180 [Ignavibacterium sp.]|nr:hypothetical protein [Ignavibacterium sp.]MDW8376046.1 hypothetical protein [Ignavibacteriales bacterium]